MLLFFGLSSKFYLAVCFWLPVCECPSAVELLVISVYIQGVFFLLETLLVIWPLDLKLLLFLPYAIASPFDISPLRFLWDVKCSIHKSYDLNIQVKLKKTSETSKSFENSIQSCAIQSAFETSHNFSSW